VVLYYWNLSETVCMPFWAILTLIIVISKKNHEMFCHVSRLTKWFPCSQQKDHHAANKILTFSTFWRWDLHLFMIVRAWRTISNTSASDTDSDVPFEGPFEGDSKWWWWIGLMNNRIFTVFGSFFWCYSVWFSFRPAHESNLK